MGTRVAITFANIFMSVIETEIILHSSNKPLVWKRYIDDIFSLSNIDLGLFLELANNYHSTIKFMADTDTETQTQRHRELFWIHMFTWAKDSRENLFLTCARISNRHKHSNTQNSPPATLQESGRASQN